MPIIHGFAEPEHARDTVAAALAAFAAERRSVALRDLVVVIAALNEADNLGPVLDEIPDSAAGIPLDVLVVDDGSTDDTAATARRHGAAVVRLARNCGHGVALRAGYRAAWERGARYIATLDADGQWDPATLPEATALVHSGEADMVIGSRALGETKDVDSFRTLGVRVFAALARALTGVSVTDTSSGLRVMRSELLQNVRQTQPQYQTSELLLGALLAGYTVAEVPTVMRPRMSGHSKKGRNFAYGLRYARVMLTTWWRESRAQDNIRQTRPRFGIRMVRYALGSAICLAVSLVVLFILATIGMSGGRASLLASAAGLIPGYPLNRTWTFGRRGRSSTWREVIPYWATAIGGAMFSALLVHLAGGWAKHVTHDHLLTAVIDLVVYMFSYGIMWLLKFAYLDRMLFRPPATEETTDAGAGQPAANAGPLSSESESSAAATTNGAGATDATDLHIVIRQGGDGHMAESLPSRGRGDE